MFQSLVDDSTPAANLSTPCVLFDMRGVIAWMPWESNKTGSRGAARFVDGKWSTLDDSQGWPDKILQLVPLLDGSILQLIPNDDGSIKLAMSGVARESGNIKEDEIEQLVKQLSDPDQVNRDAAYAQLTRYGPGAFPILQKLQDNQPPSAQSRIAELLKSKITLTLGPITLQSGPVKTAARMRDGGVVLYCDAGVSVVRGSNDQPALVCAGVAQHPAGVCRAGAPRPAGGESPAGQTASLGVQSRVDHRRRFGGAALVCRRLSFAVAAKGRVWFQRICRHRQSCALDHERAGGGGADADRRSESSRPDAAIARLGVRAT